MEEDKEKHDEEDYNIMLEGNEEENENESSLKDYIDKKGSDSHLGSTRSCDLLSQNRNTEEEQLNNNEEKAKKSIIITTKEVPKELPKESKIPEVIDNSLLGQPKNLDKVKAENVINIGEKIEDNHIIIDNEIQPKVQVQSLTEKLIDVYNQNNNSPFSLEEFDYINKDKKDIEENNENPESQKVKENDAPENSDDEINFPNISTNINNLNVPHFIGNQNQSFSTAISNQVSFSQTDQSNFFGEVPFKSTHSSTENYNG